MSDDKKNNDDNINIAMLFAQDIMRYRTLGGDIAFLEANNVYNTIRGTLFSFNKIQPHRYIKRVEQIIKDRKPKELDELEEVIDRFMILDHLTDSEKKYLFHKTNMKVNMATNHFTIEEKARLFIEYLKIMNIINAEKKRKKNPQMYLFRAIYGFHTRRDDFDFDNDDIDEDEEGEEDGEN